MVLLDGMKTRPECQARVSIGQPCEQWEAINSGEHNMFPTLHMQTTIQQSVQTAQIGW